jgi:FkbM family methyltransferase
MNSTLQTIVDLIASTSGKPDYLDAVFGNNKSAVITGRPVIIFGSGSLGREMRATLANHGITSVAFCDNDSSKVGSLLDSTPVISFSSLLANHRDSIVVIASVRHRQTLAQQLADTGFDKSNISCAHDDAEIAYMYSMWGTQSVIAVYEWESRPLSYLEFLNRNEDAVARAYEILADEKSKDLFVTKLALIASHGHFNLFNRFIKEFSEPYQKFGLLGYDGTPEDYFYFNNDVLSVQEGEVYIDVGAFDGDTVGTFLDTCQRQSVSYDKIIAFEPDPVYFEEMVRKFGNQPNVDCRQQGVWSESTTLRFASPEDPSRGQTGTISDHGTLEIEVVSIDDVLHGQRATLIKMDPGGNVIPAILRGAARTIATHRPKIAAGAYHSAGSMFEIPLLVHELCPDYKIWLRHNTFHLCDTDMFAAC